MKITELTVEQISRYFESGYSINGILKDIGCTSLGMGKYKIFLRHCKKLGVEIPDQVTATTARKTRRRKYTFEEIFCERSNFNASQLKRVILKYDVFEYKCASPLCYVKEDWLGSPIRLQVDHINGVNTDHRVENLRFLCPNCHSQTDTHAGRNRKKATEVA